MRVQRTETQTNYPDTKLTLIYKKVSLSVPQRSGVLTLGRCFPKVSSHTSGRTGFHDVTGGVYKARERIHGVIADTPLLAIPTSWSRVADSNPNWARFYRLAPPRGFASHCAGHCSTCVALDVRAILT